MMKKVVAIVLGWSGRGGALLKFTSLATEAPCNIDGPGTSGHSDSYGSGIGIIFNLNMTRELNSVAA